MKILSIAASIMLVLAAMTACGTDEPIDNGNPPVTYPPGDDDDDTPGIGGGNGSGDVEDPADSGYPVASGFSGGNGTKSNPYRISNLAELCFFAKESNRGVSFKGKYIVLTADIRDNSAVIDEDGFLCVRPSKLRVWSSIGGASETLFEGNFDGQGHSISGLYAPYGRFFYKLSNSEISNLTIKDSYYDSFSTGKSRFTNCISYATASCAFSIMSNGGVFINCGNYGRCAQTGFAGENVSTFISCFNLGTIDPDGLEDLNSNYNYLKFASGFADKMSPDSKLINCMNGGEIIPTEGSNAVGLVRFIGNDSKTCEVSNVVNYGLVGDFGSNTAAILGVCNESYKSMKFTNLYWLETSAKNWYGSSYAKGNFSGDLMKIDEDYAKSDEFLNKLNANAKAISSSYCGWKRGRDGYPILEIVNDPRFAR